MALIIQSRTLPTSYGTAPQAPHAAAGRTRKHVIGYANVRADTAYSVACVVFLARSVLHAVVFVGFKRTGAAKTRVPSANWV